MSSRRHASEDELAVAACAGLGPGARVLIGGLGMGFSARAALDVLPADAELVVAELSPAVVAWNEGVLGALAGHPLRDPRARVQVGDVGALIRAGARAYDAIALDVDNSPHALTRPGNRALYGDAGLRAARAALRPGGRLAVWSDARYPEFERRLRAVGFQVEARAVRARGQAHIIYMGR